MTSNVYSFEMNSSDNKAEDSPLFHASSNYPPSSKNHIPLTTQPTAVGTHPGSGDGEGSNWMPVPVGIPVCPPGLEYLAMVDQLLVHQKVELLEALLGCETKNKYIIKNSMGQTVYTAKEDTDCCTRNCLGNLRPFDLRIRDYTGREVISIYREFRCNSCCCPCCLQTMDIMSPPGILVGRVLQEWSFLTPNFRIENAEGETIFRITGPICTFSCFGDVDFPVLSNKGEEVGKITKQWSGLARELFTDADHFGITFPTGLDVNMKAVLLGALFLIDFNYFERQD